MILMHVSTLGKTSSLIVALCLVALAVGCSPTARWVTARKALTVTERGLVTANDVGLLSDRKFVATDPAIQSARASLEKAAEFLPDGGHEYQIIMTAVDRWLAEMLRVYTEAMAEPEPLAEGASAGPGEPL